MCEIHKNTEEGKCEKITDNISETAEDNVLEGVRKTYIFFYHQFNVTVINRVDTLGRLRK